MTLNLRCDVCAMVFMYMEDVKSSGWLMPEFWTGPAYNLPGALLLPRSLPRLRHVYDNTSIFKQQHHIQRYSQIPMARYSDHVAKAFLDPPSVRIYTDHKPSSEIRRGPPRVSCRLRHVVLRLLEPALHFGSIARTLKLLGEVSSL
jgi:hypothetical protein